MQQRIARHRADRGPDWETCEVPLDLPAAIHTHAPRAGVLLIDCVTLWISNLLLEHGPTAVDQGVAQLCSAVEHAPSHLVAAGLTLTLKHNGRPSCPCPWHQP